jgi:NADH-quinone oxidoreductase subunit L
MLLYLTSLIPLAPYLCFFALALFGKKLGNPTAGWLATFCVGLSFVFSLLSFIGLLLKPAGHRFFEQTLFNWIPVGAPSVTITFLLDPLSSVMVLFVSGVSALICMYSISYMKKDGDFSKFFAYLSLFVAFMLTLVLGASMLVTFLGWEGVGLCSYFLIAFWFEKPAPASAGKKAMIVNRAGDFGFLIAMFLMLSYAKTLDYRNFFATLSSIPHSVLIAIALFAFLGAVGKSAQLPLVGWLPDAMEGPTPVSALIHAATMVTAGVYLMVRLSPLLYEVPVAAHVIAIIGLATAFFGAAAGCAQNDIKKVLAYSTVSQLGYMFIGVGTGDYGAAIFLMVTHAFYKGLLFLSAGAVIHGMGDEQDIKKMGGLRKFLPYSAATFFVGWFAIGGVFPFAGFWSKGEVLLHSFKESPLLWALGALTALLTAYYMGREFSLVFLGKPRFPSKFHPHEADWIMKAPIIVLAFFSTIGGVLAIVLESWLAPSFPAHVPSWAHTTFNEEIIFGVIDAVIAIIGAYAAFRIWSQKSDIPALEPDLLQKAWYYDIGVDRVFARTSTWFASQLDMIFENKVLLKTVMGVPAIIKKASDFVHITATGNVRRASLVTVTGASLLLLYVGIRGGF